jgi:uncharacterized protein
MAEFKHLTLEALRELARTSLGDEQARFRTKRELIEALTAAKERVASAARTVARELEGSEPKPLEASAGEGPKEREAGERGEPAGAVPAPSSEEAASGPARSGEAEPDPEAHLVARLAGEEAARVAHPLAENVLGAAPGSRGRRPGRAASAPSFDEKLGELPSSYGDDVLVSLPRDPRTLYLYWDHAGPTLERAFAGLAEARSELWIFTREVNGSLSRLRVIEFALASRSYYVHDLEPGRVYTAEIHLVGRGGEERLLPPRSNAALLPGAGPSPVVDDRFMRILWTEPLERLSREAYPGSPFPEDVRAQLSHLSDWSRFPGRTWGGSGAGGMGGRTGSAGSAATPTSPPGTTDGEGR